MMDWKEKAIDMTNKDIISQDFNSLVSRIQNTSDILQQDARLVINRNVTTRAWLTGFYIVEYEQHGSDRAKYGDKLLKCLAEKLDRKSWSQTSLKNARAFQKAQYLCQGFRKTGTGTG